MPVLSTACCILGYTFQDTIRLLDFLTFAPKPSLADSLRRRGSPSLPSPNPPVDWEKGRSTSPGRIRRMWLTQKGVPHKLVRRTVLTGHIHLSGQLQHPFVHPPDSRTGLSEGHPKTKNDDTSDQQTFFETTQTRRCRTDVGCCV